MDGPECAIRHGTPARVVNASRLIPGMLLPTDCFGESPDEAQPRLPLDWFSATGEALTEMISTCN